MFDTEGFKGAGENIQTLFRVNSSDIKNRFFISIRPAFDRPGKNARVEWIGYESHTLGNAWCLLADCFLYGLRGSNYSCDPIVKSILSFGESVRTNHGRPTIRPKPSGKNRKPKIVSDQNIGFRNSWKHRHCIEKILNEIQVDRPTLARASDSCVGDALARFVNRLPGISARHDNHLVSSRG